MVRHFLIVLAALLAMTSSMPAVPAPWLAEQTVSTPEPTEQAAPTPELTEQAAPTPELTEQAAPTPEPTEQAVPTPESAEQAAPTPKPTEQAVPTPEPTEQAASTPEPTEQAAPTPEPTEQAAQKGAAETRKVIDRITDPGAAPGFFFEEDSDSLLEIWFPPIRDQDCAVFLHQGQVWMLDCGDERAKDQIVPLLRELGITRIDRLFNTHPHHDHLNGLYAVAEACSVEELLICFPEDATRHMTAAMEFCKGNGIPVTSYDDEAVFNMGDGTVTFTAWMKVDENENMNDRSAQFMITYGDCSMLFMADMELRGQRQLYESMDSSLLKADILRYPHHGKMQMNEALFSAIDPALAIITNVTKGIDLKASTKFLAYHHVPVAYTNMTGSVIHLITDGSNWLCELVPFTLPPRSVDPEAGEESKTAEDPEADAEAPAGSEAGSETSSEAEAEPEGFQEAKSTE